LPLPKSSSHYPEETTIRIDSYPAGGVFLTLTRAYFMTELGSPLAQLRTNSQVCTAPHPQGPPICQGQDSNLTPRSYAIDSPHILTTNWSAHFNQIGVSGRRCTRRLRGRNDLSGQLNVRHAFNMTRGRIAIRSLNDTDGDRFTPKTSMPCCCTIVITPGLKFINSTWLIPR